MCWRVTLVVGDLAESLMWFTCRSLKMVDTSSIHHERDIKPIQIIEFDRDLVGDFHDSDKLLLPSS